MNDTTRADIRIFHNPRCSKSRQARQLLEDRGIKAEVVEYLKTVPSARELDELLDLLGMEPRDLMRRKEAPYRDNRLDDPALSREELIEAMISNPILIERPIVIRGNRAVIGRPPEKVLELVE